LAGDEARVKLLLTGCGYTKAGQKAATRSAAVIKRKLTTGYSFHREEDQMQALRFVFLVSIVLAMAGGSWAADKANEEKTGLQVGAKAPAFTLKDQDGKVRTLEEFLKKGKAALVFYRSAGW
jgi:hypothetical protein